MIEHLMTMAHSPIRNYIIPGLTSYMIGAPAPDGMGCVRLLHSSREHQENVVPHSHRFDFTCMVLKGCVRNLIWTEEQANCENADTFRKTKLRYMKNPGQYERTVLFDRPNYSFEERRYTAGCQYSMKFNEIHSIYFSRDTYVLFFEGPEMTRETFVLEPLVNGTTIPTFKVEDWMFKP